MRKSWTQSFPAVKHRNWVIALWIVRTSPAFGLILSIHLSQSYALFLHSTSKCVYTARKYFCREREKIFVEERACKRPHRKICMSSALLLACRRRKAESTKAEIWNMLFGFISEHASDIFLLSCISWKWHWFGLIRFSLPKISFKDEFERKFLFEKRERFISSNHSTRFAALTCSIHNETKK